MHLSSEVTNQALKSHEKKTTVENRNGCIISSVIQSQMECTQSPLISRYCKDWSSIQCDAMTARKYVGNDNWKHSKIQSQDYYLIPCWGIHTTVVHALKNPNMVARYQRGGCTQKLARTQLLSDMQLGRATELQATHQDTRSCHSPLYIAP